MSTDPSLLKPTDTSDDEWKPGDEGITLEEVHGVKKRRVLRKCTARKSCRITIKTGQRAVQKVPKESAEGEVPKENKDATIIKHKYTEVERKLDLGMMMYLGYPYTFSNHSIDSWDKDRSIKSFLGCKCAEHQWFLTTRKICNSHLIGFDDSKGENGFTFFMRCRTMCWGVKVKICASSGVAWVDSRSKRPAACEPGFLPRAGPFIEDTLNRMYHSYFRRHYDACSHENRCAEMYWLDGDETDESGSAVSAGGTGTVAGSSVVSEVATARIESSRPKHAAASGPKSYTEEI